MTQPAVPAPSPTRLAKLWRKWLRPLLVVVVVLFLLRSTFLDWNVVPTGSMKPTILEGDYILVNRVAYDVRVPLLGWRLVEGEGPQRGDIVIFEPPNSSERYVKRIVGLPGDVVQMRDNRLFVNGLPSRYDFPAQPPRHAKAEQGNWPMGDLFVAHAKIATEPRTGASSEKHGPAEVPKNHYFMLGDNRGDSKDSRAFGFVPRERVIGKAMRVVLSLDPAHSWQPRMDRFLLRLL